MKHPLQRILRLRALLEEISLIDLEARLQEVSRIETGLGNVLRERKQMRQLLHREILEKGEDWQETQIVDEWLAHEYLMLAPLRKKKQTEADVARDIYLERRKEHQQIGTVIEAGISAAGIARSRREQLELDDWFGQRKRERHSA